MPGPGTVPEVTLRDGVVVVDYGRFGFITIERMRAALERAAGLAPEPAPVLLKGENVLGVDLEAMRLAGEPEVAGQCLAMGLLVRTFLEQHMARMFLWYHRPSYAVRVFREEREAMEWLRGFLLR